MRVHELAKELGVNTKVIMDLLASMKVQAKSHSSTLDEATVERVRRRVKGHVEAKPAEPGRVATTPSGERILGMRKIVLPPPPPEPPAADSTTVDTPAIGTAPAKPASVEPPVKAKPALPEIRVVPRPVAPPAEHLHPASAPKVTSRDAKPAMRPAAAAPGTMAPQRPPVKPGPPRREGPPRPMPPRAPVEPPPPSAAPAPAVTPPRERIPKIKERIPPPPPPEPVAPPPVVPAEIEVAGPITVGELAAKLGLGGGDVVKRLLEQGVLAGINHQIGADVAAKVAEALGSKIRRPELTAAAAALSAPRRLERAKDDAAVARPPVVTVMGHVDHGKTSLLDAIRQTDVAEREAGGITQHIGAYHVTINKRNIVFLDTPGHEAFTLMRARGAKVTDIVILVVAADDGVMPQTREAIDHARAANVPIVVAINKVDKPNANPERVKRELTELDLMPEEWGGKTVTVEVSARKKTNIDLLLEMILLVTDIGELKANPKRNASGTVLEAKLDKGRGPVATILVQDGTLRVGDTLIAGTIVGKVRALIDDRGRPLKTAGPATPVEVLGLGVLPAPGDAFQALTDAAKARQIALFRQTQAKEKALGGKGSRLTLESLQQQIAEGGMKELPIIIKADVQGSSEVLADTLAKLSDEKVKIRIIHSGVGAVNESDVLLASASNAIIIAFNVRPDRNAEEIATRERVDIRMHSVIYNVTDEMKKAMTGLLEPTFKEVRIGIANVRETFKVPKYGTIAGCMVTEGRITRAGDTQARLLRDNVVIYEGKIGSLRRFKDDASEVKAGFECGIGFERFHDIKVGDVIEAFVVERVAATA